MKLIKDRMGRHYKIASVASLAGGSNVHKPMMFLDVESALRFVRGLVIEPSFWRILLAETDCSNNAWASERDLSSRVAAFLVRGRVKIYEMHLPSKEQSPASTRSVPTSGGRSVVFFTSAEAEKNYAKNIKRFRSKNEASSFVAALNLSDKSVKAIVKALPGRPSRQIDHSSIVEALISGLLVIEERVRSTPKVTAVDTSSASDLPGNRKVDVPPAAEAKSEQDRPSIQTNRDSDQAETLIEAAEAGTAFCEDCAA
ncbi:hypothetical protein TDB9533_04783 [Thalassocella blandensis]|nr:hypothetical protein TDB9533_04783 [Thalassocella blandensis]